MYADEVEDSLHELCGVWKDTKQSYYTLTAGSKRYSLDVATERPNGTIHKTSGLVIVEWKAQHGRVVWGRGGPRRQYTIESYDGWTLTWKRIGSPSFQWTRVEEVQEEQEAHSSEVDELEAETFVDSEVRRRSRHSGDKTHVRRARLRQEFQEERYHMSPSKDVNSEIGEVAAFKEDRCQIRPPKFVSSEAGDIATDDGCLAGRQILAALQAPGEDSFQVRRTVEQVVTGLQTSSLRQLDDLEDDSAHGIATPERVAISTTQTPEASPERSRAGDSILAEQGREATQRLLQAFDSHGSVQRVDDPPPPPPPFTQTLDVMPTETSTIGPSPPFPYIQTGVAPHPQTGILASECDNVDMYAWLPSPSNNIPRAPIQTSQITSQVEYWFSDQNMARDNYMRSLMDEDGWIFLCTLLKFSRMQLLGVDLWALRLALIPSRELELDGTAYYVRIREPERRERWLSVSFPWFQ